MQEVLEKTPKKIPTLYCQANTEIPNFTAITDQKKKLQMEN